MVDKELIRKLVLAKGWSIGEVARELKVARQTIRKCLADADPPRYHLKAERHTGPLRGGRRPSGGLPGTEGCVSANDVHGFYGPYAQAFSIIRDDLDAVLSRARQTSFLFAGSIEGTWVPRVSALPGGDHWGGLFPFRVAIPQETARVPLWVPGDSACWLRNQ